MWIRVVWVLLAWSFLFLACASESATQHTNDDRRSQTHAQQSRPLAHSLADTVVFAAIEAAGGYALDTATVSFQFRDGTYGVDRRAGVYVYTRSFRDSLGQAIEDVLSNEGFTRIVSGRRVQLSPKLEASARADLNSVVYFSLLPRFLADPAVERTYVGKDSLRGRGYHLIRVAFQAQGGGVDHEDEFLYWFDTADLSLDYLAYAYATDGGGVRFREAFNARRIAGILVQDYRNYSAIPENSIRLDAMSAAFERGELELLSTIELVDVRVQVNPL